MDLSPLGRFHPLLVHLPIGVLLLAFLFELLSQFSAYRKLKSAVRPALLFGAISAVATAFSGYWLSQEGGYDERLLRTHKYLGIGLAVFSVLVYLHRRYSIIQEKSSRKRVRLALFFLLLGLLIATGHFGGSLTHGEDYLFPSRSRADTISSAVTNIVTDSQQAYVFEDLVKPVLEQKCFGCHSSKKQKGQLRMDTQEMFLKGGKHGVVLTSGKPEQSELYKRITIPLEVEHHMPPREREQLTLAEIELFHWWIKEGAAFDKQVKELKDPQQAEEYLTSFHTGLTENYLSNEIAAADEITLAALRKSGVVVLPISSNSNYLRVSIPGKSQVAAEDMTLLKSISSNIVEIEITGSQLSLEVMKTVSELREVRKLSLRKSILTDPDLKPLVALEKLATLNLTSTGISDAGIETLGGIHGLRKIYLYQTRITKQGIVNLHQLIPTLQIDTGNYQLPLLPSDTTLYKRAK